MKHYMRVTIPAKEERRLDFTTCDLCKEPIQEDRYNLDEVRITRKTGASYPEGGAGAEFSFDCCGQCFETKLIPWMQEQGAVLHEDDWDL